MYDIHTLANGIKVVHIPTHGTPVCYCGLLIDAGARDETAGEYGIAHFVEHTIFKGTTHRNAYHILNRMDEVGGELNAYTTKEETVVHVSFLSKYFERAAELIADMVFCSTFPSKEIEREREVIIDEISSYKDNPAETLFDELEDMVFADTPLGHNILGTVESVRNFDGADARRFCSRTHNTDQMAFAVCGDISQQKVLHVAQKYFGCQVANLRKQSRQSASIFKIFDQTLERDTHQAHVALAWQAPSGRDDDRLVMSVVNNLLGGPCMNSRLSVALRERNGIAYNVETSYTSFDDNGLLTIYFGTDQQNIKRSLRIVDREIERLATETLTPVKLNKIVRQYTNQLMMSADSGENLMLAAARSAVVYNTAPTIEEICRHVEEALSPTALRDVCQKWLCPQSCAKLIYV